jgi:hypothetical protein
LTPPSCAYTATPSATQFGAQGGTGTLVIQTTGSCSWSVTSSASWIALTGPVAGQGSGSVGFTVAANTGTDTRSATLNVGDQTVTLSQVGSAGQQCTFTLAPTAVSAAAVGATGTVTVTTQPLCTWTAISRQSWITIASGGAGTGSGAIQFVVSANNAAASRQGVIDAGGQSVTFTQLGSTSGPVCSFILSPPSASYSWPSVSGTIAVQTQAGCVWAAVSQVAWVTITAGGQGTGSGAFDYTVAYNNTTSGRMGAINVGGRTAIISQTANPCPSTVTPESADFPAEGGMGIVNVTIMASCPWSATSQAPWITITAGGSGQGDGQVRYLVTENTTSADRVGTLAVAGHSVTIKQLKASTIAALSALGIPDPAEPSRRPAAQPSR